MSLSPAKNEINPPVFGTVAAKADKAAPAIAEATTAPALIPATASEYAFIAKPKGIS